ncbi:phosphoribosyl-ATP pyrophosphohydrolase/phosphoribosyl-AMP cyclohydrolase [Lewinella marina]|uniref:Histidine biosynthesis bifunctional protein HisIE n=1 Tax=Neolewinella marina TaxID=438751 RepID=A0A2G0CBR2_9BACT|nr:bifunctional phosphoribosyl-AMP cyclohydrolase/phosphoribosyl-ATP diphosphatase HisIE [Neolewinella marina]NJB87065.1 phosphoribosyl-ATP pyrophosphohydrolase/phosphoribosyl-AMP cyclohydrolase [Neolewinella marina]PHK97401.1 bifunctional phosphoribosyl-AMP cyclohydrolase/phosphoribosyl-ATP diphosphatase [Neolewinella marina]
MQVTPSNLRELDFSKDGGLLPAIVQDSATRVVLMQGYMNAEALAKTLETGQVTFFSRSKQRLWTKGESSGNVLTLVRVDADCDRDSLLIQARPAGPTCHTGADTCWDQPNEGEFLDHLERTIQDRRDHPSESSYTTSLLQRGINKVAQKVGEEAVELVIEAKDDNKELFLGEAADLMYHYLVLLAAKGYTLEEVRDVLRQRHK